MGDCKYCGKSAGWFKNEHKQCANTYQNAAQHISDLCVEAALTGDGLHNLQNQVQEVITRTGFNINLNLKDSRALYISNWGHALDAALDDHMLSDDEIKGLNRYRRHFQINQHELDQEQHFTKFQQALILKTIREDNKLPGIDFTLEYGRLPFRLMKSETLIWVFNNVQYLQEVTQREFRGSSLGASFRVAKGVYIRPSMFRGRPVETKSLQHLDTGLMGITTKHIYFTGSEKSFRIRLDRIVSVTPYSDGIGVMRDTARAKPEAFVNQDGWFTVNLLDALEEIDDVQSLRDNGSYIDDLMILGIEDDDEDRDTANAFIAGAATGL